MTDGFIYLDYAATTPVDRRVAELMLESRETRYANPSSNHVAGRKQCGEHRKSGASSSAPC